MGKERHNRLLKKYFRNTVYSLRILQKKKCIVPFKIVSI